MSYVQTIHHRLRVCNITYYTSSLHPADTSLACTDTITSPSQLCPDLSHKLNILISLFLLRANFNFPLFPYNTFCFSTCKFRNDELRRALRYDKALCFLWKIDGKWFCSSVCDWVFLGELIKLLDGLDSHFTVVSRTKTRPSAVLDNSGLKL